MLEGRSKSILYPKFVGWGVSMLFMYNLHSHLIFNLDYLISKLHVFLKMRSLLSNLIKFPGLFNVISFTVDHENNQEAKYATPLDDPLILRKHYNYVERRCNHDM